MGPKGSVGIVGLGFMGAAFAKRLLDAGVSVVGTDVNPQRIAAFVAMGGQARSSVADVARTSRTIILAVYDAKQVIDVLEGEAGLFNVLFGADDALIITTTTCSPEEITDIAARASASGVPLIECSVSGTSQQVLLGQGVGLVGGGPNAIDCADDLFAIICPQRFVIGKAGDAARAKLAVNLVLQLNRAALAEGLVLAERLGLDPSAFLDVLKGSAASSRVMFTKGEKMVRGDFAPESRIAQTLKDATLIVDAAHRAGQRLPLMEEGMRLLKQSIDQGGPDRDSSAVIETIRHCRTNGPEVRA